MNSGPCKEVIKRENFSVLDFPVLQCWPKDAGRFITLPCVTTRDPRSGKRNLGMYRMQVYDERTTGMHWQRQKVAAEHARERMRAAVEGRAAAVDIMARSSGGSVLAEGTRPSGKMEVAVAIGTDPAVTFSAIVPAPPDIEEYLIAGFLRGAPVELVKCETVDLEVPASSEIVLEGYVNLDELRPEGPSAITPASTRSRIFIRSSISLALRTARIPSTPRPLWASLRKKTPTWVRQSNAYSCR